MKGPRILAPKYALALTICLLLPACSPRKPIPSDPPDARPEATVRGHKAHHAAQAAEAPKPAAPTGPETGTVVSEVKDPQNTEAQIRTAEAKADAKAVADSVALATDDARPAAVTPVKSLPETKAVDGKTAEVKPEAAPALAQPAKAMPTEAKPAPAAQDADAKTAAAAQDQQAAKELGKDAALDAAQKSAKQTAPRAAMVQIASFSTEKNADAALAWLKDKGFSEARVERVEQGQAVYHRVQAGPFQDLAAAHKALEELKADWPQAFIPAD
ncbi:MAG: SPOR domain-containing protein [Humidesulfovibrio sp.]|nr:SPOR domain-containing protein [Humidesulfovibrio sp.]